jgi:hypothetical protein
MTSTLAENAVTTLEVVQNIEIAASIDIVFESLLEQMGPQNQTPDREPLPMVIEPWPGGRWFRDFGNNTGHLWGHVQSIKPSTLLEIHGPLFMSGPAINNVLYRLSEEAGVTRIQFSHHSVGRIPPRLLDGVDVNRGWANMLERIRNQATGQASSK